MMDLFHPENYTHSVRLFLHLLGAIYFFSFGALLFQIKGLLGTNGILPISRYLKLLQSRLKSSKSRFYRLPTLFWWNSSDTTLLAVPVIGTCLGLFLLFGGPPAILLPILIVLHLSIVSAGQDFLSFGWEGFLLEISYNAFLLSLTEIPNLFVWISINLLVCRFHFEAGTSKLESRDPNWRNLTALKFHYESQPLPNTIAWYIHKLPLSFHKFSTLFMFFVELVVPFIALFGQAEMRLCAFILFFLLQYTIWATGNLSYLNHLTSVLLIILIANAYFPFFLTTNTPIIQGHWAVNALVSLLGLSLIILQLIALRNHYFPTSLTRKITSILYPWHLANRYGIFAIMTTDRYEIVFEGSDDQSDWKEYLFFYKPSDLTYRPHRISPYQPRIDWQVWFLPFRDIEDNDWVYQFLYHLLKGTPDVLSLLKFNPFQEKPPRYIRAQKYLYTFTDYSTKKETGRWWNRQYIEPYSPILELKTKAD